MSHAASPGSSGNSVSSHPSPSIESQLMKANEDSQFMIEHGPLSQMIEAEEGAANEVSEYVHASMSQNIMSQISNGSQDHDDALLLGSQQTHRNMEDTAR